MKASDLIQAMTEAGAPMEAVMIALRALEAQQAEIDARDAEVAARRAKDAERKRLARVHGHSTDIPETVRAEPSLSRPPNENISNPPTHTHPEHTPRAREADPFPCPVWCEKPVWADLKRNRHTKKLANTATAHRQFVAAVEGMADDAWPPGRLVEAIVAKGWGGAHDPRDDRKPGNDRISRTSGPKGDNRDGVARALDRRLGLDDPAGPPGRWDAGEGGPHSQVAAPRLAALR